MLSKTGVPKIMKYAFLFIDVFFIVCYKLYVNNNMEGRYEKN